ncbi:MAG: PilT/PilU family type 4a pilus ATPase, partial [Clostridiales bacterium]|nr:PilT/PilU family type 4a pilus ATPase [Clostridiales bacterium]
CPISFKIGGRIVPMGGEKLMPLDTANLIAQLYALASSENHKRIFEAGDDDFSFSIPKVGRFRVNAYKQRGSQAAVLRVTQFSLPDYQSLNIPPGVIGLARKMKGLVLITGSAGSGKSTTLSCIINQINHSRNAHIITLEDPLEFLHRHDKSVVSQREVSSDTQSYVRGLRAALRQAPNVILLGEMRDLETITIAMTAAETGQLVLSTLHTVGASNTIDRIIDVFPPNQQQQIRVQLSMVLEAVVSQQLIPGAKGGMVPAFEIMIANNAIRNMIRESKIHQMDNVIYSSGNEGMVSMDASIVDLYAKGLITRENAEQYCINRDLILRKLAAVDAAK